MSEIRTVEIDGQEWFVLSDVLAAVGKARAESNPMFVARIPEDHRQQLKLDGRWTWLVTEFGAEWAAGQDWRKHGDPAVIGYDRAATRAYAEHRAELRDEPQRRGRPKAEQTVPERIADEYRRKIRSGQLPPGEKMPRFSFAAKTHGVAEVTIKRAYGLLRDEGLVRAVSGRNGGYRVVEVSK